MKLGQSQLAGADKYRSPGAPADSTKRAAASAYGASASSVGRGLTATNKTTSSIRDSSNKKGSPVGRSGSKDRSFVAEVPTLEQELQENPDLVYDPLAIRRMLLVKIGQLGETIRHVQSNNFQIEDDVLEKLRLLKGFNDRLQQVSVQSAQQARQL